MRDSNVWPIVFSKHPPLKLEITRMLQRDILVGLSEVGKARASLWFNDTWTCERGNYTNATAGYVGNNLSSSIESHWRYMRRYTVGCAGIHPAHFSGGICAVLEQVYMLSQKHADKILCPITGAQSEATYIPSKIWKKIQEIKVIRLLLSYCEASQNVRKLWAVDMEFFQASGKRESFPEAITRF